MPLSPEERLRQLDELLRRKEDEKKRLKEQEELTEKELARAKKEIEQEIAALREDEEVRELFARVRMAESRGAADREAEAQLHRRGLHVSHLSRAEQEELENRFINDDDDDDDESDDDDDDDLESLVQDAPRSEPPTNLLYDLQQRLLESPYTVTNKNTLQGLLSMHEAVQQGRDLSENEYHILHQFHETVEQQANNPYYAKDDPRRVYASKANDVVESIRENLGLRIGDTYLRDEH